MGFALLAAQIIFITVLLGAITTFSVINQQQSITYAQSSSIGANLAVENRHGSISLISAEHDADINVTTITFSNDGPSGFYVRDLDLYIDDDRQFREKTEVNMNILIDTGNLGYVDPADVVQFTHMTNTTSTYRITTPTGASLEIIPESIEMLSESIVDPLEVIE